MIALTYSRLQAWETCPRLYRFQYVDRIPTPPRPALFLAQQVHLALQRFMVLPIQERTEARLEELLRQHWRSHPQRRAVFPDPDQEAEYGRRALTMLRHFCSSEEARRTPEAVEQWFELDVTPEVRLNGKVDRIDRTPDGLVILDYKTGRLRDREEERTGLQPVAYAFLVSGATGEPVREVVLYFLLTNERVRVEPTREQLEAFRQRLLDYAAAIQAERRFDPTPGPFCALCDYRERCREGQEYVARVMSAGREAPELPF